MKKVKLLAFLSGKWCVVDTIEERHLTPFIREKYILEYPL